MTDLFAEGSSELADVLLAGEYFFRASDADRMARVETELLQSRKHLLVTGRYDGIVDHYGNILLKRLKGQPGLVVEIFLPSSIESMVERFNELLGSMQMDQARGEKSSEAPNRVLVINDPQVLEGESWSLLSRMVADFPGLNMHLVFLLDRLSSPVDRALERFGSRLIRWEVAPPDEHEQIILRKTALGLGLEFQVERVLTRISQEIVRRLEPEVDLPRDPTQRAAPTLDEAALDGVMESSSHPDAESLRVLFEDNAPTPKRRSGVFFRALFILIILGAGLVIWQPDLVIPSASDSPPERTSSPVLDAAVNNQSSLLPAPPTVPRPLPNPPESRPVTEPTSAAATTVPTPEVVAPPVPLGTPKVSASTIETTPEPAIVQAPPTPPVAPTPPAPPPAPAVPQAAPRAPLATLLAAPDGQRVVQLIVLTNANAARDWIQERRTISEAIVVPVRVGSRVMYAVVMGPFATEREARETIQGKRVQVDYWIRSVGSLKQVLADAN